MSLESPFFTREEFACACGCGFDVADSELLDVLEGLRFKFDAAVIITSGCRCKEHNKEVGGSENSQHIFGKAVDFKVENVNADDVAEYLLSEYPDSYGIGRYDGRTHIDVRDKKARWDERGSLLGS